ncbi:MAG TPA: 16S rRNA (guanine(527)-N(7))-methyltransferase RsmG [Tepidisphaeraceae bacterium]|nr:16S rRNA (guanine(527)-N(7))-methyltransferase RsmG [Tepidisphaeraceae bacterium]
MNELWNDLARRAGIELAPEQHDRLNRYLDLLIEANARMNLTRITDRAAAELQHVADALTLLPHLRAAPAPANAPAPEPERPRRPGSVAPPPPEYALRIADVGSGGGVPGIPLAIARPDAFVLLIESTKKKSAFLRHAADQLGLKNIGVSDWRAEDVARSNSRESFDVVVARAVATMDWLAEWCLPLVRKGGTALAMKGPKVAEELPAAAKAIRTLAGGDAVVHPVDLPGTEHRVIVEIPKLGTTDKKYPRPATQAKGKAMR